MSTRQIPIIKAGEPVPEPPCHIIGRDGFYLRKANRLFECTVRVPSAPELEAVEEKAVWLAPKIPYAVIEEALEFFCAVHDAYGSEAIAMLTLRDGKWGVVAPAQKVSPAHLDYEVDAKECRGLAGTIHSHGSMGASFSGTDHRDVTDFDGVHIVLGRIAMPVPQIAAGVYANGRLFEFRPEDIIEGLDSKAEAPKQHPWMAKVVRAMDGFDDSFEFGMRGSRLAPNKGKKSEPPPSWLCPQCGEDLGDIDEIDGDMECRYCGSRSGMDEPIMEGGSRWIGWC